MASRIAKEWWCGAIQHQSADLIPTPRAGGEGRKIGRLFLACGLQKKDSIGARKTIKTFGWDRLSTVDPASDQMTIMTLLR